MNEGLVVSLLLQLPVVLLSFHLQPPRSAALKSAFPGDRLPEFGCQLGARLVDRIRLLRRPSEREDDQRANQLSDAPGPTRCTAFFRPDRVP